MSINKYLNLSTPYTYIEISSKKSTLFIEYGIVGNNDFNISYFKDYSYIDDMYYSYSNFVENIECQDKEMEWPPLLDIYSGGDKTQLKSMIKLINNSLENKLILPDNGIGYTLLTDKDNLQYCLNGATSALQCCK